MLKVTAKITTLIDKKDNMEIIRDEISAVLALEIANQQVLAVAAGKNPDDYNINVYTEKTSPWELVESEQGEIISQTPIANVYLESASINNAKASDVTMTVYSVRYNIDCLAAKNSKIDNGKKYTGDELAAREVQRVARLIRNILQSAVYRRLNYGGIFNNRSVSGITMFQPQFGVSPAQHTVGCRIVYTADITEFSPEYEAPILDLIQGESTRGDDGKVLFDITFPDLDSDS